MKFVLLSGSFHSNSRSLAILQGVKGILEDHETSIPQLNQIPLYCEDLARDMPASIESIVKEIKESDGIIVCTPEYNHSVPAVLKNAIDWASRPAFNSVLKGKPISIITQAVSPVGGARAQAHLKLIFDATLAYIHPCHEMMISGIDQVLDDDQRIVDDKVLNRLVRHINQYVDFVAALP